MTYPNKHVKCIITKRTDWYINALLDVHAVTFEGAKVLLNKGLSNHFQVSHAVTMSSTVPSGYRFGATYVGTRQFTPMDAFPVLIGEIDPAGNLNANIIHQFTSRIRCKAAAQVFLSMSKIIVAIIKF